MIMLMIVAVSLLPGCSTTPASLGTSPTDLIGVWRVDQGQSTGTVLEFSDSSYELHRSCGGTSGSWNADDAGNFIAMSLSGSLACQSETDWMESLTRFAVNQQELVFHDEAGTRLVQAHREAAASSTPNLESGEAPTSLPADLRPATAAEIIGHWYQTPREAKDRDGANLNFEADHAMWTASACGNGTISSARWIMPTPGYLLVALGTSQTAFCAQQPGRSSPAYLPVRTPKLAGFAEDALVVIDEDGKQVKLYRSR